MFINILYLFIALAGVNAESADEICQLMPAANGFGKIMSCAHYSNWFSYHPDKNECLEFSYEAVVATKIGFKLKQFAKICAKIKLSNFE
ncbi:LOW QUALITY PROTEIN: uncharacterized protein LOC116802303 [Drosophila sechellia]|uniref:LOW QUALITY PROTEIN: uncharacterized protein LOC116802303 n=1 Tax=Drosophila sechellia TaxID=7238 RepID=UPI0013DE54C3|nr:LOW QUALITY PROTEIN: uncharacterized protein LOC116802303 [Drosophila sechellia]